MRNGPVDLGQQLRGQRCLLSRSGDEFSLACAAGRPQTRARLICPSRTTADRLLGTAADVELIALR
jgi:hypothetical protein